MDESMTARISLSVILGVVSCANAQSETLAVDYLSDVKPILASKCFACHGALRQQASLRLDAASLISVGGDSGPAVVPGDATESVLLQRVSDEDPDFRMPPEGEGERLTEQQVALLRAWILAGAPTPADEPVPADPREHWAYQPITRTELPSARKPDRNQIDDLLDVVHLENGLQPAPAAERATWLRRVYFNLIGLPPTRAELREYLADDSAAANLRVVDDLLARPEYGQHWGRHWMDVWRYSDWAGFGEQVRYSQKHIWRWRD